VPVTSPTVSSSFGKNQINSDGDSGALIAFDTTQITHPENRSRCEPGGPAPALAKEGHAPTIASPSAVRRLTPRECERLQGFPDDYTLVQYRKKPAADGPRYKSIGNSMATVVMAWLGRRISAVEGIAI
jgi:DNA (cytosine-5)-methyltransferase 1